MPATEQPDPIATDYPPTWPLVIEDVRRKVFDTKLESLLIADMEARDALGRERYKVPLQPHNGRDSLRDAMEEAYDFIVYLKNALIEAQSTQPPSEQGYFAHRRRCKDIKSIYDQALRLCAELRVLI